LGRAISRRSRPATTRRGGRRRPGDPMVGAHSRKGGPRSARGARVATASQARCARPPRRWPSRGPRLKRQRWGEARGIGVHVQSLGALRTGTARRAENHPDVQSYERKWRAVSSTPFARLVSSEAGARQARCEGRLATVHPSPNDGSRVAARKRGVVPSRSDCSRREDASSPVVDSNSSVSDEDVRVPAYCVGAIHPREFGPSLRQIGAGLGIFAEATCSPYWCGFCGFFRSHVGWGGPYSV